MHTDESGLGTRFGGFRYSDERKCLARDDGTEIRLRPKTLETFRYLAVHANRVVDRESLHRAIWGRICVTDDSLGKCIAEIRHAIGDPKHEVLNTLPRHGYMLVADRIAADAESEEATVASIASRVSAIVIERSPLRWPRRLHAMVFTVAIAVALVHDAVREPALSVADPEPVTRTGASTGADLQSVPGVEYGSVGTAPDRRASDVDFSEVPEHPRRTVTVSLQLAPPIRASSPGERASLDAVVVHLRGALSGMPGVALTEAESNYRFSVTLRERGADGERCIGIDIVDAHGAILYADSFPLRGSLGTLFGNGQRAAETATFWADLFTRMVRCEPRRTAPVGLSATVDRGSPTRHRWKLPHLEQATRQARKNFRKMSA